jgi:murein DD-endopeptidase MepM/ murein hydrolase activator NlpD
LPTGPTVDRRPFRLRSIRPLPAAAIAGLAALLIVPILLGAAPLPANEVRGALATPAPTDRFDTEARNAAAVSALAERPDPAGEDSSPSRRIAPLPSTLEGYAWPVWNARLTLPYGPTGWGSKVVDGELFHDGIDLATRCGDRINAAHAGVVLAAGRRYDAFMGWVGDLMAYAKRLDEKHLWGTLPIVVVIDDGNGYRSVYAHFRDVVVAAGDVVEAGDLLGHEGMTGRATGCHLHYGLFSPDEVATFGMEPVAAAHMLLPTEVIARIDPLLVLPPLDAAGIH